MRRRLLPLGALAVGLALAAGCGGAESGERALTPAEDEAGIVIERVVLTASGAMIDLRYRVVDADRALAELGDATGAYAPYLDAGGRPVPLQEVTAYGDLTSSGHGGTFQNGLTYYWIFANRAGLLGPGDRVDLVVGDLRMEGLVIE